MGGKESNKTNKSLAVLGDKVMFAVVTLFCFKIQQNLNWLNIKLLHICIPNWKIKLLSITYSKHYKSFEFPKFMVLEMFNFHPWLLYVVQSRYDQTSILL